MGYVLEFILPGVPKATNALLGRSYWAKHKNALFWKGQVKAIISHRAPKEPLDLVQIEIIRRNYRMLDYDGLVFSMKPIVDGLVECKILRDDNYGVTGPWAVSQEYVKKGREHVWIRITELYSSAH